MAESWGEQLDKLDVYIVRPLHSGGGQPDRFDDALTIVLDLTPGDVPEDVAHALSADDARRLAKILIDAADEVDRAQDLTSYERAVPDLEEWGP